MDGEMFQAVVQSAFSPFLQDMGFSACDCHISGRYYRAAFSCDSHDVLISWEPGDQELFVIVRSISGGLKASIDDRAVSPRLADLNARFMSEVGSDERSENDRYFAGVSAGDKAAARLLKAAKDLRLVLPRHMGIVPFGNALPGA